MGIGTAIGIGSVVSGALGSSGGTGTRERRKARNALRNNAALGREQLEPYARMGLQDYKDYRGAIGEETPMYGEFQGGNRFNWDTAALEADPGYQFTRDQALQATTRNQNALGNQWSGGILNALQDRAGGVASQYGQDFRRSAAAENAMNYGRDVGEYGMGVARNQDIYGRDQNYLNRLGGLADRGYGAAQGISNIYGNLGSNLANVWTGAATAQQEQDRFRAGSLNNAIQGGISNYLLHDYLNPSRPSGWNRSPF